MIAFLDGMISRLDCSAPTREDGDLHGRLQHWIPEYEKDKSDSQGHTLTLADRAKRYLNCLDGQNGLRGRTYDTGAPYVIRQLIVTREESRLGLGGGLAGRFCIYLFQSTVGFAVTLAWRIVRLGLRTICFIPNAIKALYYQIAFKNLLNKWDTLLQGGYIKLSSSVNSKDLEIKENLFFREFRLWCYELEDVCWTICSPCIVLVQVFYDAPLAYLRNRYIKRIDSIWISQKDFFKARKALECYQGP
ncbi:MAG: hypothetical protein ACOVOR_04330 [Rhabdochlamydiaceae bacterium]